MRTLEDLKIVGDVRGSHFMVGIELVTDKNSKRSFEASDDISMRIFKRCMEKGVIIRPVGNVLVLSPPLIITAEQCDTIVEVLQTSIKEVMAELSTRP